jgi:putative PIN family toxin of toxin-antitoxin system
LKRAVLDTNVWNSAWITPEGTCDRLVRAVRRRELECVVSRFILGEIDEVLRGKFGMPGPAAEVRLKAVLACALLVDPRTKVAAARGCPADNRVLECAVDGRADLVVTGDRSHLIPLGTFQGIRLLTPRQAVDLLGL